VLRRLSGSKRVEVTGEIIKLCNELYNLFSSPNNARMIKSKKTRVATHEIHVGDVRNEYNKTL
jgi:hypothetical protein